MIISCDFLCVCLCVTVCVLYIWYFCCVCVVVVVFSTTITCFCVFVSNKLFVLCHLVEMLNACMCLCLCGCVWYYYHRTLVFVSLVMCVMSPGGDAESPHVFVSLWLRLVLLSQDTCLCLRLPCNVCNCV